MAQLHEGHYGGVCPTCGESCRACVVSGVVVEIVDYLRKRDAERTGWDDGGAFGAAADEIEMLANELVDGAAVRTARKTSRTQNLTDTPHDQPSNWIEQLFERVSEAPVYQNARVAARGPVEDGGQRSREAAEPTGIEGGALSGQDTRDVSSDAADLIRRRFEECAVAHLTRPEVCACGKPVRGCLVGDVRGLVSEMWLCDDCIAAKRGGSLSDTPPDPNVRVPDDPHQIQALNEEIASLRDRERDIERGVVAEIAGYLTQLGHNWFADGDTRNSQIAYDLAKLVERGDWRAQPQPQSQSQSQPTEPGAR